MKNPVDFVAFRCGCDSNIFKVHKDGKHFMCYSCGELWRPDSIKDAIRIRKEIDDSVEKEKRKNKTLCKTCGSVISLSASRCDLCWEKL